MRANVLQFFEKEQMFHVEHLKKREMLPLQFWKKAGKDKIFQLGVFKKMADSAGKTKKEQMFHVEHCKKTAGVSIHQLFFSVFTATQWLMGRPSL